ncbi:hypothetical protein VNO80_25229 [Phaseolus coccineus]|uniref:Uncharacterized protein n=1 Tax=Phaseolus coccineus TaxID=3886 RepID=A0AAN9LU84_PHACN
MLLSAVGVFGIVLSMFICLSVYMRHHINLIKGMSTPLKYLEVLKAHFSFKFPIARTNCWAKVWFSKKKVKSWIQPVPLVIHPAIGLRFPFRNLLHLNELVTTGTIEKNAHGGACNRPRKVDSTFSRSAMISFCIFATKNLFTGGKGLVGGDGRRGDNADLIDVSEGEEELNKEVRIDEEDTIGFYRVTELYNR